MSPAATAVKETFYYAYFDGRAPSVAPDYEAHFGLVSESDNTPKFPLAEGGLCPTKMKEQGMKDETERGVEGGIEDDMKE